MKLTKMERKYLDALLENYRSNPRVQEMRNYIQHGAVSTYEHVESVALMSFWLNRRLCLGSNEKALIEGAFLHDFYLYDWHTGSQGLHGFYHPGIACRNAVAHFHVDKRVQNIIRSHMWPLTLTVLPMCREAWIVCLADKCISAKETLCQRRKSRK